MLRPETLAAVLDTAGSMGVSVEYVETNSSWFQDSESAISLLRHLNARGLNTLLVSISPFHTETVPFSKVRGVIEAARHAGVGVFPWISDFMSDLARLDPGKTHTLDEYHAVFGRDYLLKVMQRYWIHMGGRALETFRPLLGRKSYQEIIAESGSCRQELTNTGHFHIDLFDNYIPGLCAGLSIAVEDLGKPITPENYPILSCLYRHGIRGLVELAQNWGGFRPQKEIYLNKCDLCTEVRAFLVQLEYRDSQELNPVAFYTHG